MKRRGIKIATSTIILAAVVLAVTPDAHASDTIIVKPTPKILETWRWRSFDRHNGIAGSLRWAASDSAGHMWFATDMGVQKYDGYHWTRYTEADGLGSNSCATVMQAQDGAMWFSGTGTISRLKDHRWTVWHRQADASEVAYAVGAKPRKAPGPVLYQTRDGVIWGGIYDQRDNTGDRSGVIRFVPGSEGAAGHWIRVNVPFDTARPAIGNIYETSDGVIWFATRHFGFLRYDRSLPEEDAWSWTRTFKGRPIGWVTSVVEGRDGSVWLVLNSRRGILRYTPGRVEPRLYTRRDGLPDVALIFLIVEHDGTIGVSGREESKPTYSRFDEAEDRWATYTHPELPQLPGGFRWSRSLHAGITGSTLSQGVRLLAWTCEREARAHLPFRILSSVWPGVMAKSGLLRRTRYVDTMESG